MKPSITIAISCHKFQRRLSWMLSSIVDQVGFSNYDFTVDIAYCSTEKSDPPMNEIISTFFGRGLSIKDRRYDNYDRLQFRGLIRNDQIKDCKTDFMLFADTDMVYHPKFFRKLFRTITKGEEFKDYDGVMTCGRFSNTIERTNALVNKEDYSDVLIEDSWGKANTLDKIKRGNVGAGFFQLINMEKCDHKRTYVIEEHNRDWGWYDDKRNMQKARSDQQFRRHIGKKKKLPPWYSRAQIHLNHNRDNMFGKHLEEQR